jgi:hypothetical protein
MAYNWNNPIDFSSGFGTDTQGQFKDITSFLPSKQGGSSMWGTIIPAAFSAGSSLFGANQAAESARIADNTAKKIAQGQFDAQVQAILAGRDTNKAGLGFGIWDATSAATWRPDLAFGRDKAASLFQRNILDPLSSANERDDLRAKIGIEGSSAARGLRQEANREALKRTLAEKQGQMMGMFGRIAPIDTSTLFT